MNITIIGIGLIGGSIGMALKARWPDISITGYDIVPEALEAALSKGIIDIAADSPGSAGKNADFVFIAAPVSAVGKIIEDIRQTVQSETVITDVGSTKSHIVQTAKTVLSPGANFIGGHPLAGSEQEGLRAATPNLLKEAVYVLTPTSETSPEAFQKLHSLLTKLGARVMALSPEKHDEVVAAVSHLPHLAAAALVNLVAEMDESVENRLLFAAGGFRDLTRIASGSPSLWVDICLDNREAIVKSLDEFMAGLADVRDLIGKGRRDGLSAWLEAAKERRASMALGEPAAVVYREIDIWVSDRPGIISQISLTFGQLGVNIEDIQIVHLAGDRGTIKLLVKDSPNVDKALGRLREYGFEIRERKSRSDGGIYQVGLVDHNRSDER